MPTKGPFCYTPTATKVASVMKQIETAVPANIRPCTASRAAAAEAASVKRTNACDSGKGRGGGEFRSMQPHIANIASRAAASIGDCIGERTKPCPRVARVCV